MSEGPSTVAASIVRLEEPHATDVPPVTQPAAGAVSAFEAVRHRYVGSASGSDGFFGRWLCHQDGHGGNVGLRELAADAAEYDVNILEVAASNATLEEIYERESM